MRLALLAALSLSACAAPPPRYVLLESESYRCGAAEGLGCGLALAPVLSEIDALEGVAGSGVSWDGRTFRIEVLPGADAERVTSEAAALLEGEACCVNVSRGKAAPAEPDRWFDAEQTLALSRHEASVIAARFAVEIAAEVELEREATERLERVLREELERAFEQAHRAGGGVHRLWEEVPAARQRFEARLQEFLPPETRAQVTAIVERELSE